MPAQFTAIFEHGDKYVIGYCPEVPGANGQGEMIEECRESLREAIRLVLEDRVQTAFREVPGGAIRETLQIA